MVVLTLFGISVVIGTVVGVVWRVTENYLENRQAEETK